MNAEKIVSALNKWENLGVTRHPSGSVYFGESIKGRGRGWLHRIYCPINPFLIDKFVMENSFLRAYEYPLHLHQFNGLSLFYDSLYLYGLHLGNVDSIDIPFNLVTENIGLRKLALKFEGLVIGGGNFGHRSVHYIETQIGEVISIDAKSCEATHKWANFQEFLRREINRLNAAFLPDGNPPNDLETISFN